MTAQKSEAFWRAYGLTGSDTITGSDATVADAGAGAGDDWIDRRMERNGGHVVTGGEGADTFNFFAPSNRAWTGTMVDYNAEEDTFLIDGQDGFEHLGLTPHWLVESETGTTVTLLGGAQITFTGYTAEDLRALIPGLIPDLIIG